MSGVPPCSLPPHDPEFEWRGGAPPPSPQSPLPAEDNGSRPAPRFEPKDEWANPYPAPSPGLMFDVCSTEGGCFPLICTWSRLWHPPSRTSPSPLLVWGVGGPADAPPPGFPESRGAERVRQLRPRRPAAAATAVTPIGQWGQLANWPRINSTVQCQRTTCRPILCSGRGGGGTAQFPWNSTLLPI